MHGHEISLGFAKSRRCHQRSALAKTVAKPRLFHEHRNDLRMTSSMRGRNGKDPLLNGVAQLLLAITSGSTSTWLRIEKWNMNPHHKPEESNLAAIRRTLPSLFLHDTEIEPAKAPTQGLSDHAITSTSVSRTILFGLSSAFHPSPRELYSVVKA